MREGWKYKKLGDICDVINGLWVGKKEPFVNIAVIRNTNFSKDCRLKLDDVAYIDVEAKQFASRKLKYGDIIIEKSGGSDKQPVGRAVLFNIQEGDYSFSNFTAALRVKDIVGTTPKFVHRCLYGHYIKGETFKMQSKTTGLHNLDMKAFLRLPIPDLPVSEQERIVAELDLLTGIIDKQKAQLKELDTLSQSIFYDMFGNPIENEKGWDTIKIGEIAEVKTGPFGSMLHKDDYISGGIPLVNPIHMRNFVISTDEDLTISAEKAKELSSYILMEGDVIFARRGDIGRCAIVSKAEEGYLCGTGSLFARFHASISSVYIMYIIRSSAFTNELISKAKGATMLNLNSQTICDLSIIIPPTTMQNSFAAKIKDIEQQKATISRSIAETQKLFDYTIDKHFG